MLITDAYRKMNRQLHENPDYGDRGWRRADEFIKLCRNNGLSSVLDYGAGKGHLAAKLADDGPHLRVHNYDPAIEGMDADPPVCDLLFCCDVLEHIEPDCLTPVLTHMASKTGKVAYLIIETRPALKTLPDGRNAHLIVKPKLWWLDKLKQYFTIEGETSGVCKETGVEDKIYILCLPKSQA